MVIYLLLLNWEYITRVFIAFLNLKGHVETSLMFPLFPYLDSAAVDIFMYLKMGAYS